MCENNSNEKKSGTLMVVRDKPLPLMLAQDLNGKVTISCTGDLKRKGEKLRGIINGIVVSFVFPSLWDVVLALIYGDFWSLMWSEREITDYKETIEAIYFYGVKEGCASNLDARARVFKGYPRGRHFDYTVKKGSDDIALAEFMEQVISILNKGDATRSYEGMINLVERQHLKTDMLRTIYTFSTIHDLAYWLLDQAIAQNKRIIRCRCCGRLFFPERENKKYCSVACRKAYGHRIRVEDADLSAIKEKYDSIVAAFFRRAASTNRYAYDAEAVDSRSVLFDLLPAEQRPERPAGARLWANDFQTLYEKFLRANRKKKGRVNKAREAEELGTISSDEYKTVYHEYLEWLNAIHRDILSFVADNTIE